jgi:hypothetical protein
MPDYVEINLRNWDERAAIHARDTTSDYMLDRFRAGEDALHAIEAAELGDISGKRVLHLQCHIGRDTLCLVRRGATVTGLDFSSAALNVARRLSDETLLSNRGDCEDYAILKYAALLLAGIPKDDVKIVILKNFFPNENHAVVATRVDGQWLILDNRTLTLVRDTDVTRATPEFVLDHEGIKRFNRASQSRRVGS